MLRIRLKFRAFLSSLTPNTHTHTHTQKDEKTEANGKKEEAKKEEDTHLSVRYQQFSKSLNVFMCGFFSLGFFCSVSNVFYERH